MNVALIGFGVENQATYRFFASKGVYPTICDQNPDIELPDGSSGNLGDEYLNNLEKFDVIVRSVGINPKVITDKNPNVASKITTAINIFFEECKTPIIGVTGTKGKGTTSTLIHKILLEAGKKSALAGNIGLPMLDILNDLQAHDYIVLELSSFQLYDLKHSPDVAVCLMVVPEHLDWHDDIEDYKKAKKNLFKYQKSDNIAIFNAFSDNSREIATISTAKTKLTYGVPNNNEDTFGCAAYVKDDFICYNGVEIMPITDARLLGKHNLENICAAIAATWNLIGGDKQAIRHVVSSFPGLKYRLELVRELEGVSYYNDSFSTTPETAIAAIRSFTRPVILIVGGSDKGIPFDELADAVVNNSVKHVLAIGERGPVIADLLRDRGYNNITEDELYSMETIVAKAKYLSGPDDIVLLSPGCASFGMFKNYKDRGDQFSEAVKLLS